MRRRTAQTGSAFGLEVRSPPHLLVLPDAGRRSSRRTSIDACAAGDLDRRWATADAPERLLERRFLNGRLVISLCDLDGRVLRSVAPGELVGTPPLSADTARLNGGAA